MFGPASSFASFSCETNPRRTDRRCSRYRRSTACGSMCASWSLTDPYKKRPPIMPLLRKSSSDHHATRSSEVGSWQGVARCRSSPETRSSSQPFTVPYAWRLPSLPQSDGVGHREAAAFPRYVRGPRPIPLFHLRLGGLADVRYPVIRSSGLQVCTNMYQRYYSDPCTDEPRVYDLEH
jgi:hypothetical protein